MSNIESITPKCPKCSKEIVSDDVNVANDVAFCRSCNLAHKLSTLMHNAVLTDGVDFNRPPHGVRYNNTDDKLIVSATLRSIAGAVGALAISLFWNGIVSVFVFLALSATLFHLGIALPNWFPAPEIKSAPMGVGLTIFMWMFLSPFIAIGITMIGRFLMCLGGRTEIKIERNEGTVFTGIGPLGFRKRFLVSTVTAVRFDDVQYRDSEGNSRCNPGITIESQDGKLIHFGSMLSEERKKFVAALLHRALVL